MGWGKPCLKTEFYSLLIVRSQVRASASLGVQQLIWSEQGAAWYAHRTIVICMGDAIQRIPPLLLKHNSRVLDV